MRKLTLMIVSLLLVGCGLMSTPTPSPTPRPTATPTQEIHYMPTAEIDVAKRIHTYFSDYIRPSSWQVEPEPMIVIPSLISTGETGNLEVDLDHKTVIVDYLVVYDYVYLGYGVPTVKVAYGISDEADYFYLLNNEFWSGNKYSRRQAYEDVTARFQRGTLVGVNFYGDGFVSMDLRVHWDKCEEMLENSTRKDAKVFCDVGSHLEKIQSVSEFTRRTTLRFRDDWVVLGFISDYPNPPIQLP
jgi:hypothetical protein